MSDSPSLGRWLREQRVARDLTQEEMAEVLACSPSAVRKFETGERKPSKGLAAQIAQRLKLTPEEEAQFMILARTKEPESGPSSAPVEPDPIRAAGPSRTANLPVQVTSFVGRRREVEEVRALLQRPQVRLLTLFGPPGIGKTRLSLQVGAAAAADFPDGVCWIALAALRDPNLVPATIATVLGVQESGGTSILETLEIYLSERRMLLLLDNFEQVQGAATQIADLLRGAPAIKILVTSRSALQVYGEQIFSVPFLAVPDPANMPPLAELNEYEALRLFVERASAVKPSFALTERDAPVVAEICQRLEGLPLAIELAAARMRLFSPRAILARLENMLNLLEGGAIDLPQRQQTLRGAIAWSYDLLDEEEQNTFRRMGVFVGGCTLEAANEVAGEPDGADGGGPICGLESYYAANDGAVSTCIESLEAKSLMRVEEGPDGEPRFTMLETIREYAVERMTEMDELDEMRRRHAAYYMKVTEQAEPELSGPDQQLWLERLDTEHDNIRAALEWALQAANASNGRASTGADPAETGLHIAGALWRFWEVRGRVREGRRRLEAALRFSDGTPPEVQAKALNGAGNLAFDDDDYTQSIGYHQASLDLNQKLGDRTGIAKSLSNLGNVSHRQGNYTLAQRYHEESLELRRELKDGRGIAISLTNLGEAAAEQTNYDQARLYYNEALTMSRQMGEQWGMALSLHNLGEVALHQGDFIQAEQMLRQSLEQFRQLGDKRGCALALNNLGLLARKELEFDRGEPIYQECLLLFRDLGSKHGVAVTLEGLASVAGGQKKLDRAARLRGAAEGVRASIGAPRPPDPRPSYERRTLSGRAAEDKNLYSRSWAEGRDMTLEQAITYALDSAA